MFLDAISRYAALLGQVYCEMYVYTGPTDWLQALNIYLIMQAAHAQHVLCFVQRTHLALNSVRGRCQSFYLFFRDIFIIQAGEAS